MAPTTNDARFTASGIGWLPVITTTRTFGGGGCGEA
jgi:hypothetical protein